MRKLLSGRRRVYALLGVVSSAAAVAVGIAVSVGGASGEPSVEIGASAKAVSAKVSAPARIDISSLPQLAEGDVVGQTQAFKDLSPMGEAALEQAKQNAEALAPTSNEVLAGAPAGAISTPGGATFGWEGMGNSGTICSYFGGGGCQPPDMGIASDGVTAVQTVNTSIALYDAKTGALLAGYPKSLQAFAGVPAPSPAGCDSTHGNQPFLSDPRAAWDPIKKRFYVAFLQVEGAPAFGIPNCAFLSKYWVAVSATSNPNGVWNVYAINTANLVGPANNAADYTSLRGFQTAI